MSYETFSVECMALLSRQFEIVEFSDRTERRGVDARGITEICALADDHLDIHLDYKEVRACKTWGEVARLISFKGGVVNK